MTYGSYTWKPEYNIGEESIDNAHRKFFQRMRMMAGVLASNDYEGSKKMCIEIMKEFETSLAKHFEEEEAYMEKIDYVGMEKHKKMHEHFAKIMLPACRLELESSHYSERALREFSATILGWLTGHILIDDRGITNRAVNNWNVDKTMSPTKLLDIELTRFMKQLCDISVNLITEKYRGIPVENSYYLEFSYDDGTEIIVGASEDIICRMAAPLLSRENNPHDVLSDIAYKQIATYIAKAVLITLYPDKEFSLMSQRTMDAYSFASKMNNYKLDYSMLWEASEGSQVLCVHEP